MIIRYTDKTFLKDFISNILNRNINKRKKTARIALKSKCTGNTSLKE